MYIEWRIKKNQSGWRVAIKTQLKIEGKMCEASGVILRQAIVGYAWQ